MTTPSSAYDTAVATFFKRLVAAVDAADPDLLEADSTGDMVTITAVRSGQKIVVNTQRAVSQVWVAGQGLGVHFSLGSDGRFWDDKAQGKELALWVASCVEAAAGVPLPL